MVVELAKALLRAHALVLAGHLPAIGALFLALLNVILYVSMGKSMGQFAGIHLRQIQGVA